MKFIFLLFLFQCCGYSLFAGGGPENLLLVVNENSWASRRIASEYVQLRKISYSHILYLKGLSDIEEITLQEYREKILIPILETIEMRKLSSTVDYILFSADFPTIIDANAENETLPNTPQLAPIASLTGLTFLSDLILKKQKYIDLETNWYCGTLPEVPTPRAFQHNQLWDPKGNKTEDLRGRKYYLSMMLGVTSGRGNSIPEVLHYLRRSVEADGTHPKGTIYYLENDDVRAKTRVWGFAQAVSLLQQLGISAQIEQGVLPQQKKDVLGAQIGIAGFDWKSSQSVILPGAICEHLTSFGGILKEKAGQTPFTAFLKNGAAGACGTVYEPYSIQQKFPTPFIHYYYGSGCSLAEAFYQSVRGPYQLLIVGDPLCQPFALFPKILLSGLEEGQSVKGSLSLTPEAKTPASLLVDHFLWYLDGIPLGKTIPGEKFLFDTTHYENGFHELRVVGLLAHPLQFQGKLLYTFEIQNEKQEVKILHLPKKPVPADRPLKIRVACPKAREIQILHQGRVLATLPKAEGTVELNLLEFGDAPCEIYPLATLKNGEKIRGKSYQIEIIPAWQKGQESPSSLKKGFFWQLENEKSTSLNALNPDSLQKVGWKMGRSFQLQGLVKTEERLFYQIQIKTSATIATLQMGNLPPFSIAPNTWNSFPAPLESGYHLLRVSGVCGEISDLSLRIGGTHIQTLSATNVILPNFEDSKIKRKR